MVPWQICCESATWRGSSNLLRKVRWPWNPWTFTWILRHRGSAHSLATPKSWIEFDGVLQGSRSFLAIGDWKHTTGRQAGHTTISSTPQFWLGLKFSCRDTQINALDIGRLTTKHGRGCLDTPRLTFNGLAYSGWKAWGTGLTNFLES